MEREGGEIVGHRHPPAYRFNAGQKMIYWIVVLGGGAIAASGYLLMFPFYLTECVNLSTPMAKTIGTLSQSDSKIMERSGPSRVLLPPDKELPVPNTLQYPLERQRDVQRRWQQILQRTAAPRTIPPTTLKISALSSTHGKVESSGRNSPPRSRPDSTANVGRIRNG
jgi:hypothetical protein